MAKGKDPIPVNRIKEMAKAALRGNKGASRVIKSQGVEMDESKSSVSGKKVGSQDYINEGQFKEMKSKIEPSLIKGMPLKREELIKEGLFTEKNGDLVPTAKYQEYKKYGKLGKYNIK